jgi:hypothetical protein
MKLAEQERLLQSLINYELYEIQSELAPVKVSIRYIKELGWYQFEMLSVNTEPVFILQIASDNMHDNDMYRKIVDEARNYAFDLHLKYKGVL